MMATTMTLQSGVSFQDNAFRKGYDTIIAVVTGPWVRNNT